MYKQKNNVALQSRRAQSSSSLSSQSFSRRHRPDYLLIILALLLSVIGLIVVYAISPGLAATRDESASYFVIKQAIAVGLGLVAFAIFSFISTNVIARLRNILVGLSLFGALIVQIFGEEVNGAYRWIQIGGFSFQIAELIKFAIVVWVASFLVERLRKGEINDDRQTLRPLLILIAVVGLIVAKMESDLGSTGVMIAIIGVMAFVAGLPLRKISLILGIIVIGTTLAITTSEYRRDRVSTFLNPTSDCQDAGYQSCQALIAVGSGGVFGRGLGNSVQAYGYLPEAANDSIFAILAEKFGFLGVSIVIGLYVALFSRLKRVIERTAEPFARLFVIGVLAWLSTQAMINIGAMIGLLPLKGITLPFISYGGTSIVFVMAALGMVFQISRYTNFEPIRSTKIVKDQNNENLRSVRGRVRRTHYASSSRSARA